jgi:hypothetical protein
VARRCANTRVQSSKRNMILVVRSFEEISHLVQALSDLINLKLGKEGFDLSVEDVIASIREVFY